MRTKVAKQTHLVFRWEPVGQSSYLYFSFGTETASRLGCVCNP